MTLDPTIDAILKATANLPRLSEVPVPAARKGFLARIAQLPPATETLEEVRNLELALPSRTLPLRLYRPQASASAPLILFLHGGGFVLGNLDSHDAFCRRLCARSGHAVLAVDYRLAPEHPWPAAHDDAWAALQWAQAHAAELGVDTAHGITVAGDSAGGALAAGLALRSRDERGPVNAQLLIYPVVDLPRDDRASYRNCAEGYGLTRDAMDYFVRHYLPRAADAQAPYALPLHATSHRDLAPALVITAEYDVLRDEGEAYARTLEKAGTAVQLTRYDGMHHGFMALNGLVRGADTALQEICAWLKQRQNG